MTNPLSLLTVPKSSSTANQWALLNIPRLLFFIMLLSISQLSYSDIIAMDDFEEYPVGNIAGNNSGTGWGGAWQTGNTSTQAQVIDSSASPLSYTDSASETISGGNRALNIQNNHSYVAHRTLSQSHDETVIYASMLIQFTGTQNNNDFLGSWIESPGYTTSPNFGIKMNEGSGGTDDFFVRTLHTAEQYSTNLTSGQTYFLVMKLWKTGSAATQYDQAQLWVNPPTLETEPSASTAISSSVSNIINFSNIGIRSVNLDSDDSIIVDRIIYGTSWEDVTAIDSPVLDLRFDETSWDGTANEVTDSSGNNYHGTSFNGAQTAFSNPVVNTSPGTCYYGVFDGSNYYIEIPHYADLNGTDALTYMAWVNASQWSGVRQIMAKSVHGGGSGRAQMGIFSESGVLKGRAETESGRSEISATLPSTGNWHHISLVYSDTSLELFIDGVSAASTTFSSRLLKTTTDPLSISKRVGTNQYFFDGLIDEIKVFKKVLTQTQIQALMAETHSCDAPPITSCTDDNVRDNFSSNSYNNNDGSKDWVSSWQETGESDGVSAGQARVSNSNCSSGNCLRIGTPSGVSAGAYTDRGVSREVDLSGVSSATLTFNYFTGFSDGTANVALEVSNDGGSSWTQLQNYIINSTSFTANPESFDLTPYIAENTQIRFIGSGSNQSNTGMYIDDIDITSSCNIGLDHLELSYATNGLTCLPSPVTLKACANSDCSSLYTEDVDITLSPASGWVSNPITISSGSSSLELQHTIAEDLVIDITASSVAPTSALQCFADSVADATCTINFSEAGFIFDIPTQTACKPSVDITIAAVKKSNITDQCVGALTGTQSVNFWSTYSSPASGTNTIDISSTAIDTSSPGTAVDLDFDINGEATFTVQYDDAGQVQIDASHTAGNGLELTGNDQFISKPFILTAYTDESNFECISGDASCNRFKKAGEQFDLKVNAACWESDSDTDFRDNAVTPNFELTSIAVTSSLVAPAGGSAGNLDIASFNFTTSDSGTHTMEQAISEVGVFNFAISPPNYFGEPITTQNSPNIGRFYPDHFQLSSQSDGAFGDHACATFTYSGQDFTYTSNPSLTITAYNAASTPAVTQNYTGDFVKIAASDFVVTSPTTDANQLGADNASLVNLTWTAAAASLTDFANGNLSFSFGNDTYNYLHRSNSLIAPFTNAVNLTFTAITDNDGVQTQSLPVTLQPSGERIRFGRLAINNAHGSELLPLPIIIQAEYFNGVNWQQNAADQCTSLNVTTDIRLRNTSTATNVWQAGNSTMTVAAGTSTGSLSNNNPLSSGSATLTLSAPGEDNEGYVEISSNIAANYDWLLGDYDNDGGYDDDPIGRGSFGLFKGSDNIIFRREVY